MNRRITIILHGPPGVGKSEISKELMRRLDAKHISLDDGWCPSSPAGATRPYDFRYNGGTSRYRDIEDAKESVLMIEIGCGEPVDLSHSGATRAAGEWIDVLKKTGREIFAFLLRVDPADAVSRIEQRIERDIQDGHKSRGDKLSWLWAGLGLHFLYLAGHETAKFAEIARFSEIELRTSGRTVKETADEIMAKCNLGSQDSLAT